MEAALITVKEIEIGQFFLRLKKSENGENDIVYTVKNSNDMKLGEIHVSMNYVEFKVGDKIGKRPYQVKVTVVSGEKLPKKKFKKAIKIAYWAANSV